MTRVPQVHVVNFYNAAPNNGMHPTADTNDFIFLQSLWAARDARRSAADVVTGTLRD